MDIATATAADLGRAIGAGEADPVDLARAYLDAIAAHPDGERIYARTTPERALAEAGAASERAKAGLRRSLLDGVPISWKDLVDTAGTATEAGTALLRGRVPDRDATVLRNASAAGLVCLGKTHLTELAFSGLGLNPVTATPPCVNDPEAVPGGSSSGAAASVAFGLAAAGIGSDTAGSVRLPAGWNDLVGLKTAHGTLSNQGVVPLCPRFDTIGPLTRSVEDAALLLAAMAGGKAPNLGGTSLKDVRLLALETVVTDAVEDAPRRGYDSALGRLRDAGARIDHADLPMIPEVVELAALLFAPEGYGMWKHLIEAHPEVMFDQVRERFRGGASVSAADFVAAWERLKHLRAAYREATSGYDAVVLPTCAILPPNRKRLETDSNYFAEANLLTLRNTRIGSLLGLTGLTLPTGTPSTGILFQTPPGSEGRLLRLGAAAERALA